MTSSIADAYLDALAIMQRRRRPRDLREAVAWQYPRANDDALHAYLSENGADDPLRAQLRLSLATWDRVRDADWTAETEPNTEGRRAVIIGLLNVGDSIAKLFADELPVARGESDIVIADMWEPWYTERLRAEHDFYWKSYRDLLERKGWAPEAIASLDVATDEVVERLSDPTREEAYQAKGLVVGYVQSGKTANFTGVVGKAIDAGYRLIIVLTGTTDLLRAQTQRRLDMELIGVENILGGVDPDDPQTWDEVEYRDDADWGKGRFLSHGVRPSDVERPEIHRLTSYAWDYKSLQRGIAALDFPRRDRARPFFSPVNLAAADAKVAVVKKNATVLRKLVRDLNKITAKLGEIPALIIDDESDQASVNTSNPKKWLDDQKERTAINRLVSELLKMLPRGQYVGYTATPFANVFIDPSDAEDIFPKDFLISLRRPPGYMGASDFHDLESEFDDATPTFQNSQKCAHVRCVDDKQGEDDDRLLEAMDAFVLTGAMKLYREGKGAGSFRHHTMLVHETMMTAGHRETADRIQQLWRSAGYYSSSSSHRLNALFDNDVLPVALAVGCGVPIPSTFEELLPYMPETIARIGGTTNPVIVVNSDKDINQEDLDFDKGSVWRILVGGNKLARGFTVEGLTVSYYRRLTKQADTMMQMGRWFGFRKNYRDLVRLYITRELYEGFEAIVRDEEYFRNELRRYAKPIDGESQITPKQIPPLVAQHLPWLKPAAANKMYNAVLIERRSPGLRVEPRAYSIDASFIESNVRAFSPVLATAGEVRDFGSYKARIHIVSHRQMVHVLSSLAWSDPDYFEPDLCWIRGLSLTQVDDWVVIFPQHVRQDERRGLILGRGPLSLFRRKQLRPGYFSVISEPRHHPAARRIAGIDAQADSPAAAELASPKRGAILVYPVIDKDLFVKGVNEEVSPRDVVMAFCLYAPRETVSKDRRLLTFTTIDSARKDEAIITRPVQS